MDPHSVDPSLQKTSPTSDPAAIMQLTTELSAQANQLSVHQHQLNRLTSLTEELVKTLQSLRFRPPEAAASPPVAPDNQAFTPAPAVNPRLAFPEKFDGNPAKCKGFLLQCSLFVNQQPALYPTDFSRISFVCSLLSGKALDWATAVWREDGSVFPTFSAFLRKFKEVFEHPAGGKSAGDQLLSLCQGKTTAAEYTLTFRTLAAQTNWVDDTLKLLFRKGLSLELQAELACRDEGRTLSEFIELAIQIDNLLRSRHPIRLPTSQTLTNPTPEPMQLGYTPLHPEERERRRQLHLCLYCGQAGHIKVNCPIRPSPSNPKAVSSQQSTSYSANSFKIHVQ